MSLIEHNIFGKVDKVKIAIERIKSFNPLQYSDEPYYVAYSGGKDSDVIRILTNLAGVKHDLVHNLTTVDAPETMYYIRTISNVKISKPIITMWELIVKNKFPPTRLIRYCCTELKERGGNDRFVMTGVRWSESSSRKNKRDGVEVHTSVKNRIILNADNDESRRFVENCQLKGKRILNPIIDWSDVEVWEFLKHHGCKSNPLYECGYRRVGCVGCSMSTKQKEELERYPKYKAMYIRAFDRMIDAKGAYKEKEGNVNWKTGEEVYDWWVGNIKKEKQLTGQISMSDLENSI